MLLLWDFQYWDSVDRKLKDRHLVVETSHLDPVTKAAIELVATSDRIGRSDRIVKFRHLFREDDEAALTQQAIEFRSVGPLEYFEDERGRPLSLEELGPLLTGNPNVILLPHGARQHDVDLMLSDAGPLKVDFTLSNSDLRCLAYFSRDLRELRTSEFKKNGPGRLCSQAIQNGEAWILRTAVSEEEIRSFVTVFRRLYMTNEPFNFENAVNVFVRVHGNHPRACWVEGERASYVKHLEAPVGRSPVNSSVRLTFTPKRIIDVYLYTRFAHQPDERRERQYRECLAEIGDQRNQLTWVFLTELHQSSLKISNAGQVIAHWFDRYCAAHALVPDVVHSLGREHQGVGALEKEETRAARQFAESVNTLAALLWDEAGRPDGGQRQYLRDAEAKLRERLA